MAADDEKVAGGWLARRDRLEAGRLQFTFERRGRDAVVIVDRPAAGGILAAWRWGEVDDGQASARLERRQDAGVHRGRIDEVMVDVAHEQRVARGRREVRLLLATLHEGDVVEPRGLDRLPDFR